MTPSSSVAGSQLPDDVLKFYEDAGVDAFAREVCTLAMTWQLCLYGICVCTLAAGSTPFLLEFKYCLHLVFKCSLT